MGLNKLRKLSAGLCALMILSMITPIPKVHAGIGVGVAPDFPIAVVAGTNNVAAGLEITNASTPDIGAITLDSITLTPQCGDSSVPCTNPDPGIFFVHATGTGADACLGNSFSITVIDAGTGKLSLVPSSTIVLALGATCRINFLVDVLKAPTIDASASPGLQTVQSGEVTSHDSSNLPGTGTGTDTVTVSQAQSSIVTNPSPGGVIGSTLFDTATVTGLNPTGTVTFALFAPGDTTCTVPIHTSIGIVTAGLATSGTTTATSTGTYRYTAQYSGDANNLPAFSGCGLETVVIASATPSIVTLPSVSTTTIGGIISDTATLSGGFNPTGTITFNLYAPNDPTCTLPISSSSVPVNGNGVYVSGTSTVTAVGTYNYIAVYSGDANNASVSGTCGQEQVVVPIASSSNPCIGAKFYSPRVLHSSPPRPFITGTVLIGGVNFNNPVAASSKHIKLALADAKGPLGALNQQFVAFQLSLSISSGCVSPIYFSMLDCPLSGYGLSFPPFVLSNGVTISPSTTLGELATQIRLAIKENRTSDYPLLTNILKKIIPQ